MKSSVFRVLVVTLLFSLMVSPFAGAQTTITYSAWGNEQELAIEWALIEAFEKENPDINVELITPAGNYEESLMVWAIGGEMPDVVSLNRERYPQFQSFLAPVDAERARVDMSVYISPVIPDALVFNGVRLGLPKRMNTKVMLYSKDAFDEAGIGYPEPNWTPDDYANAARVLTRVEGERVVRWGSGPLVIWNWFHAFGGSLYNEDRTQAMLTSREIQDATMFMVGLHKQYAGWFDDFANFNEALATGQIAMFTDVGPWYVPDLLAHADYDWRLAPLPGKPLDPEVTGLSISASTQNYDAALRFVQWVSTSDEAQRIIATGTNLPLTRYGAEEFIARAPEKDLGIFFYQFDRGYQFPPIPERSFTGIDGLVWTTFYDEILVGKIDPLTGLQRLQAQVQAMINDQISH